MDPLKKRYDNIQCLTSFGIVEFKSDETFQILVLNFGTIPKLLLPKRTYHQVQSSSDKIGWITQIHAQLLGLMSETKDGERNVYCKLYYNESDVEIINQHLAGEREKQMSETKNPFHRSHLTRAR